MVDGPYDMTLEDVKPWVSRVASEGVPCGLISKHVEPGFLLVDGTVLLESEKDENGFYIGGAGMDGMYLKTGTLYEPVRDDNGKITSFRRMAGCLGWFSGEEQQIIFQYAMNTPEHLIEDLTAALPALKKSPRVHDLFRSTAEKLKQVPPGECQRLMADIRAAYKGRNEQSIRERQQAAEKSAKKKRRSFER